MAHLERESSNTLFETLEDWEAYLQAENVDFTELSRNGDEEVITKPDLLEKSETSDKSPARPKRKLSAQRLMP